MKSWAHTYLAGSLLGTALIVAALVAFVPLVALNAPEQWPALGLGLVGGGRGGSDVGVSGAAIVATAQPRGTGGLEASSGGPSPTGNGATVAIAAPNREASGRRPGGAEVNAAPAPVAASPASAEVVARNPGPPGPERPAATPPPAPPSPTETDGAPVPASAGGLAETPAPAQGPIEAGVGGEEPEAPPPPEGSGSTPPPLEGSGEEGEESNVPPGPPGEGGEGEEAQPDDSEASAENKALRAPEQASEGCSVTRCVSVEQLFGIAQNERLR